MTTLAEMSMEEASGRALAIMLVGAFEEYKEKYAKDSTETWQEHLISQYDLDEDEDFSFAGLADNSSAWQEVKYEGAEHTLDGFTAKRVAEYGGEGEGDQYWVVISLSDGEVTRYFRKDGWYASYDGGELDGDTSEVRPAEKTVVVYE